MRIAKWPIVYVFIRSPFGTNLFSRFPPCLTISLRPAPAAADSANPLVRLAADSSRLTHQERIQVSFVLLHPAPYHAESARFRLLHAIPRPPASVESKRRGCTADARTWLISGPLGPSAALTWRFC